MEFRTLGKTAPSAPGDASPAGEKKDDYGRRTTGTPLTLSKVLNVLDGVPERTGQIIIMSANHPERLDPALLRPGRVDKVIRFGRASANTVERIVGRYFPGEKACLGQLLDQTLTPAEVIRSCTEARSTEEAIELMRASVAESTSGAPKPP